MAKVRVYELAKQHGWESKDVLKLAQDMGEYVRSASSTLEPHMAAKLVREMRRPRPKSAAGPSTKVLPSATRPRLRVAASKGMGVRRGPKPPFTKPGEHPPKPSEVASQFKPAPPAELTEGQVLRNLLGADAEPNRRPRAHAGSKPRAKGNRGSRGAPKPTIAPDLLDEWQIIVYRHGGANDLEQIDAQAKFWESTGIPPERVRDWLQWAPDSADGATLIAMHEAGFTPREAFTDFSPHVDNRTTTAYGLVRRGKSPKEVKGILDLARARRRGMQA